MIRLLLSTILVLVGGLALQFSSVVSDARVTTHKSYNEVAGRSSVDLATAAVAAIGPTAIVPRAPRAATVVFDDNKSAADAEARSSASLPSRRIAERSANAWTPSGTMIPPRPRQQVIHVPQF